MSHRLQHLQKKRAQNVIPETQTPNIRQTASNKKIGTQTHKPIFLSSKTYQQYDRNNYKKSLKSFPPPQNLYKTKDTNISPKILRVSQMCLPSSPIKSITPISLWISPFADNCHIANVHAPLRCPRCKGYINAYFQLDGARRTSLCNLCGLKFVIQQNIDKNNINNTDILTRCCIDFKVTDKFYFKRKTQFIKVVFLIQMSMGIMQIGAFASIIQALRSSLENHEFGASQRIAITFYNDFGVSFLRKNPENPEIPNVFNVPLGKATSFCCPLSDDQLYFNPSTQKQFILNSLDYLTKISQISWKQGKFNHYSNYVFALNCVKQNFQNQTGRVILFSLLDPRVGICSIKPRTQQQLKTPLKPTNTQAYDLGRKFSTARMGIEHYVFSKDGLISHELANYHYISTLTGGKIHFYSHFNSQTHGQHLYYSIYHTVTKQIYYDIDFTCRASQGINTVKYGAPQGIRQTRDVGLAIADSTSSFTVELDQQQKQQQNQGAYAQFAIMYTSSNGDRMIRTINFKFDVSSHMQNIYQSMDYLTVANYLLRLTSNKLIKGIDPSKARNDLINILGAISNEARSKDNTSSKIQDLYFPQSLFWSLSYLSSAINSRLFLNWIKMSSDQRIIQYLNIQQHSPLLFSSKFYPKLYPLTLDIYQVQEGQPMPGDYFQVQQEDQQTQPVILPSTRPLTKSQLKDDGVYLVDNGSNLTIIIMPKAQQTLLIQLFGDSNWENIEQTGLPQLQSSHNIRVNNMINEIRRRNEDQGCMFQPLSILTSIKKGPFNQYISNLLKQDHFDCNFTNFLEQIRQTTLSSK